MLKFNLIVGIIKLPIIFVIILLAEFKYFIFQHYWSNIKF